MSNKYKTRVSVTMTKLYVDAIDSLVEEGIYLDRGEAILEALRDFLEIQKMDSIVLEPEK